MNTYFVVYPRDFANEYTVYAVRSQADALRFEDTCDLFFMRIPKSEALRLGIHRPAEAAKDGEQWYGGFIEDVAFHALEQKASYTTADRLKAVFVDTMRFVEMVEGGRQSNANYTGEGR